jgi:hypothetical protein
MEEKPAEFRQSSSQQHSASHSFTQHLLSNTTPNQHFQTQPTISKMKTSAIFSILALAAAGVASPLADAETLDSKLTPVFNPDV